MVVEENQFSEEQNPTLSTNTHPLGWAEPNKELDAWEKFQLEEKERQKVKTTISNTILPSGKGFYTDGQVYNPDGNLMGGATPNEPASVFDKPSNVKTVGGMSVESNLPDINIDQPVEDAEKDPEKTDDPEPDIWLSDDNGFWLDADQKGLEPEIKELRQKYNDKFYGVFEEAREQAKSEGYGSFLFQGKIHSTETDEEKAEREGYLKNYLHTSFSHISVTELDKYLQLKQDGKIEEAKKIKESWPEVTYNKNTYLQNNIPYKIPEETRLNLNNDMFQYDIPAGMLPGLDKSVTMTGEQIEDKYLGGKMPHNNAEDDKKWHDNWINTLGTLFNTDNSVFKHVEGSDDSTPLSAEEIAETMISINDWKKNNLDQQFLPKAITKNSGLVIIPGEKDKAGNVIGKERIGIPQTADEFIRWANSVNQELYRKDNMAGKEYLPTMAEGDLFSIQNLLIGKRLMDADERASFVKTKIQSDPNYSHVLQDNLNKIPEENKWMLFEPLLYNSIEDNNSRTRTAMGRYMFAGPGEKERTDALSRFNEYEISQGRFTYFDDIKLDPGFIPELGVDESLWQKMRSGSETNKGYLTDKIYQRPGGSILDWGGNWNDGKNVVGTVTEEGNTTPYGSYKFDLSGSVSNVFNIQENRTKWISENGAASLDARLNNVPENFKSTVIVDGQVVKGKDRWKNYLLDKDIQAGYNRIKFNVFDPTFGKKGTPFNWGDEPADFDKFISLKSDYEKALKTGNQEEINNAKEAYFGYREEIGLGDVMYDHVTKKLYNVKDKDTPIYIKESNKKANELAVSNNKEGLENMLLYKAEELRFFLKEVVDPHIKDYGYNSFETGETFVGGVLRNVSDFIQDSEKQDIDAIKKAIETGELHHSLTNLPGRHPVAEGYNKLLSELMVIERALVLNEDVTSEYNEPGRFIMGGMGNFAGQKTKYVGDFKYQDMASTLANPYSGVFAQQGLEFNEQRFSESQHSSFSELAFGLIPDLAQFAGEVYLFKKFSGNTINNITKSLTSRITASTGWWAKNPWTRRGLTTALAANAEGLTFLGSEYTFGGITKFEEDIDYSSSYRFGFGLGISGKVGQGLIKRIPAKHWFSPITAQLSKSQTLVNFNQNLMGGSVAGMSFITTGAMETLYQEYFDDKAGIDWNNVKSGFTMKHISAEILKMTLFQKMHSPFSKNGLMRGIQKDILNFQGRIPGSKRAAEFFYKDLGFESWKDFHREYAGDKGSRKATQEDVNNGLAKKEGDVIYNEGNGKKIEDLYKSEFNKIINGEGKYAGLNAKERGKKISELKEHVINLEGAQQFNALRTSIAKERKNGNFPTDTEMHVLINRIKEGQSIEKWSVEDFNAFSKLPIAGILGRLGLNPRSKQAKTLIKFQEDAMGLMEALDKGVFKTPRGSKERTAAFNFLMERSKIHNQIEDLQNKKKEDKSLDVDKKIENLQNKLKEMQEGGSKYNELMTSIENKYKEIYEQDRREYVDRRKAMGQKFNMVEVGKKDFKTGNYEKGKNEFQKEYKKATGRKDNVKDNPAFIHPVTGKIYINYARAMEVRNPSTIFHEDIHFQTKNVLKDANGFVTDKGIKIIDGALQELSPSQRQEVEQKINDNYKFDDKGRKLDKKEYYDEYLTVMGEMMKDGKISYTDGIGDKLTELLPVLKKVFPNLSTKGEGVGRQMFDVIKGLAKKPLQLDDLKKLQEGTVKPGSRADIMNMKVAAGQMGQTRPIPASKERTPEEKLKDKQIKDLLIQYKKGAKSPENITKLENLEKIKAKFEAEGKKASPELQKDIDALRGATVDAGVLPKIKELTKPLLNKYKNMFDPQKGGDVASARIAIENTLEKLYDTYKPTVDGKPNPVEFIGYADNLMRKRMPDIFEKYGFKVPESLLPESSKGKEIITGKIDPVSLVRNPDIGIVNEIQSNLPANLEGKSFSNLGNLAINSTSKIYGIPVKKLKNKQDNLNQKETEDAQNALVSLGLRESFKLKPEKNVAPQGASENVRGRSLNIDTSLLNAKDIISGKNKSLFIDTGERASGKGSQPFIKKKNNKLSDAEYNSMFGILPKNHPSGISKINNPNKAAIFLFGKEAVEKGLTKEQKKEARAFFNKIGQRLKAEANLFGTLSTNTTVRKLKFKDEGIVNVLNDIALGKSKAMFSKEQDLKEASDIRNKYKLNESQFRKSFETVLDNGELKNKELQQDLEQLSVNISKTEFYAEIARNKNFKKKFQEERLNTDFDKNFAEKLGVSSKEATKLLNELQDSNASFFNSNGKLVDKNGYKKFSEQWGDFYNFWGEMGAEFGTRKKGTNLTKFFEQITWVGERTTGKGKDFDLIGDSGKNKQTVQFNIDKSKKSLRDVIENHKDLNEAQKKDLLEQFDNIDFTKIDPAVIAKQNRWRKLVEQEAPESKKIKDLQKEIPQSHVENMGNIFNLLKTMERYWFESKEGSGKIDAARFLYQTSRMNSNLVFGQRSTFGNKYFYITEGFQGMGMKNPIWAEAYNEAIETAKKDPSVLTKYNRKKKISETITVEEYAKVKANNAAKFKGEHATDSATVQLNTWVNTVTGKGTQGIGTLNLNNLIQVAAPKVYLDIIDKALGTNAEGGILRFTADSRVRNELSKFKKPFGGDLLQDITALSKKLLKENPAFSDHILNDSFLNSNSTSVTLKAKTRNRKQTIINHRNMVEIGNIAGVNTKNVSTSQIFNKINNLDKAMRISFSKDKGLSGFDFDDTVARSKSKVLYTLPNGTKGKLSATEFARRSESLEAKGAKFDFSQFNKVIDGKKGPLFEKLENAINKFGNENVFIITARPQSSAKAIHNFLKGMGVNLKLENIVGLENGSPRAKADWFVSKVKEGFNDIYFVDDAPKNVKAVDKVIKDLNLKGRSANVRFSKEKDLNKEVNAMIEYSKGIGKEKTYTATKGKLAGKDKKGTGFYLPSRAEDFMGLVRPFFGKGKEGIKNEKWWNDNFTRTFAKATKEFQTDQRTRMSDYRAVRRELKENVLEGQGKNTIVERNKFWEHPLKNKISDNKNEVFTNEHAVRVYNWAKQGVTAKELNISKKDFDRLVSLVENNGVYKSFADQLVVINKGDGYPKPTELWATRGIQFDMRNSSASVKRDKYFKEFNENVDVVFSEQNLNKMEAALGTPWRKSIENMLFRMKTGSNRPSWARGEKWESNALDWLNLSVNDVMFLNTRSALLQQVSMGNYVNYSDNNIFKASKAFANQPQFWKDYVTLMNSEWALNRREGLKFNIQESEIIDAASNTKNRSVAALQLALSKGFVMTKYADSHATAFGGAAFYRNRINTYTKKGFSEKEAKKKAMEDWMELSDQNQQSARADKISNEQASLLGRFTLNFNNVTLQYGRLAKKDVMDLANGRVDGLLKGNNSVAAKIARITYYMGMQNAIFYGLQNAMFVTFFDDDIGESLMDTKQERVVNGMLDNILIGSGVYGKIAATVKNFGYKVYKESGKDRPKYSDAAWELTKVSPPVDIKLRKFRSALKTLEYDMDEIKTKGFSLDNPALSVTAKMIEGATNAPTDRILNKSLNIESALQKDREAWQRISLLSGFADYDLGIEDETIDYNPQIESKFKSSKFKSKFKKRKF